MLPDFFTHPPGPAIVGGLGLAVVWCAVKKKGMMRALFFYVSATSVLKERKKEGKKEKGLRVQKNYYIPL